MTNALIGWQNAISTAALSGDASTYSGFPASNLALDLGGNAYAWRTGTGGSSFTATLAAAVAVRVISLHRTNLTAAATWRVQMSKAGASVYDSGVVPAGVSLGQCLIVLAAAITADSLTVTVTDPANPQAYLSIPFAYAGPVFAPSRQYTNDATFGGKAQVDSYTSRSGNVFSQFRWRARTTKLPWQNFLPTEMLTVEAINAYADTDRNLLIVPRPDALTSGPFPIFGTVSVDDRGIVLGGYRSSALTITERL